MRTELTNRKSFTQRGWTSLIVQIFLHAFIANHVQNRLILNIEFLKNTIIMITTFIHKLCEILK